MSDLFREKVLEHLSQGRIVLVMALRERKKDEGIIDLHPLGLCKVTQVGLNQDVEGTMILGGRKVILPPGGYREPSVLEAACVQQTDLLIR